MNKDITETPVYLEVSKLFNTWIENLPLALSKVKDPAVLKELLLMSVQKNRPEIRKLTIQRLDQLGISYDKSIIV